MNFRIVFHQLHKYLFHICWNYSGRKKFTTFVTLNQCYDSYLLNHLRCLITARMLKVSVLVSCKESLTPAIWNLVDIASKNWADGSNIDELVLKIILIGKRKDRALNLNMLPRQDARHNCRQLILGPRLSVQTTNLTFSPWW